MNSGQLVDIACRVYGNCPPPTPTPTPTPPQTKKIEFKQQMALPTRNYPVAEFTLPVKGQFRVISLNYTRNGVTVNNMTTQSVSFTPDGDKVRLKIKAFDFRAVEETNYRYTVFGVLEYVE